MEDFNYNWLPKQYVTPELYNELAIFYSSHYGKWSDKLEDKRKGKRVVLSEKKIEQWFTNDLSELWTVRKNKDLIGYAVVERGKSSSNDKIIWVTQFVVHEDYRNIGIGKKLLFSIWGFSSYYSWGLVTANPYAIRALEKATRRRCEPKRIKKNILMLLNFAHKYVAYIDKSIQKEINPNTSKVNTNFPVDHSELEDMLANVTKESVPWNLGSLPEGWEWFAFTFNDQAQIELSQQEIENMLNASDQIVTEAYGRMPMDDATQKWAKYTNEEVDLITDLLKTKTDANIIDIGCGMGRHTIELASRGYSVIGIDAVKNLIDMAEAKSQKNNSDAKFFVGDIYKMDIDQFKKKYDCALCLYDVVGSYADNKKNIQIVKNISTLLKSGGYAIFSVMNLHYTEHIAKNKFALRNSSLDLLNLKASNIMEKTGNVFNPDYFLLDEETKVIYRKEIFSSNQGNFPTELIVRDRRFYKKEIEDICKDASFEIIRSDFVNAGWKNKFDEVSGKEILIICKKV